MPVYRIYTIGKDGHIAGPPVIIDAADDQGARQKAKRVLDGHAIEVWNGTRRIAKFDPLHR
jgi:hypothetical protein